MLAPDLQEWRENCERTEDELEAMIRRETRYLQELEAMILREKHALADLEKMQAREENTLSELKNMHTRVHGMSNKTYRLQERILNIVEGPPEIAPRPETSSTMKETQELAPTKDKK